MSSFFNGEMLSMARDRLSMTQKELSSRTNISQSIISKSEMGLYSPSPEQIKSFSSALSVTPVFFEYQSKSFSTLTPLLYRRRITVAKRELDKAFAIGNITVNQVDKMLEICQMFNKVSFPFLDPHEYNPADSIDGAKQIARAIRRFLGISSGPIESMVSILENNGVMIFYHDDFNDKIDGFTIFPTPQFPYIFVNSNFQGEKIRMTLAHELGHIVMHRYETPTCEEEAWAFASEFLAPETEFLRDISYRHSYTKINSFFQLKYKWKISVKAMVKRLVDLEIITERTARYLYSQLSPYKKAEPYPIEVEQPRVMNLLIKYLQDNMNYSFDEIANLVGFNQDEFSRWYDFQSITRNKQLRLVSELL